MLAPVLVDAPAADVVSLAEVKQHLRVDHSDDDAVITALIKAAISHFDGYSGVLGRALVTQTWRQDLAGFYRTDGKIRLPLEPLQSITKITYYDGSNVQQDLPDTVYGRFTDALGPYVALQSGQSWPSIYSRSDAVSVEYVVGYGDPDKVPAAIRTAIILTVRDLYAGLSSNLKRETVDGVGTQEFFQANFQIGDNPAVNALIAPFRRMGI